MRIVWSDPAISDLSRVFEFLAAINPRAAARVSRRLRAGPIQLLRTNPRLGTWLPAFAPREIRRLIVDDYEIRYEIQERAVLVLNIWHVREDR